MKPISSGTRNAVEFAAQTALYLQGTFSKAKACCTKLQKDEPQYAVFWQAVHNELGRMQETRP